MKKIEQEGKAGLSKLALIVIILVLGVVVFFLVYPKGYRRILRLVIKPVPIEVIDEDRNGDEKPDVYLYKRQGVFFRTNRDRNFDGHLDEWIDVKNGKWVFRKSDEDFNRVVDLQDSFSSEGVLKKRARDFDGDYKFEYTEFYDAKGGLERAEQDTNLDGKVDVWKFYKDGRLVKTKIDSNFDGKPDRTETLSTGESTPSES